MSPSDLLTPAAVAELRGCSEVTVRLAIHRGDLSCVPVLGARGKVSVYAVRRDVARRWKINPVGRPALADDDG